MKTTTKWTLRGALLCAALSAAAVGCGPNDVAEQKAWNAHVDEMQKYEGRYPGFKSALEGRRKEAQATFDAGKALGDKEQKVAKMREANDRLADILTPLENLDHATDELTKLMADHDIQNLPAAKVNPALDAAKAAQARSNSLMKGSSPANAGEAKDKVREATAAITAAETALKALKPAAPPPAPAPAKSAGGKKK